MLLLLQILFQMLWPMLLQMLLLLQMVLQILLQQMLLQILLQVECILFLTLVQSTFDVVNSSVSQQQKVDYNRGPHSKTKL